jgi:membrane protein
MAVQLDCSVSELSVQQANQEPDESDTTKPRSEKLPAGWRARYEGSFAHDLLRGLGAVDFGDRIIIFGACMLLSVLPLIIVLSAYASHRIQDDIAHHLGLSRQGVRVVDGLFKASVTSFNLAIFVGLLVSFFGTISVARSVEVIYERAFQHPPLSRTQGWLRCLVWVVVISGAFIADGAIDKTLRNDLGSVVFGLVEFVLFTLFFWWSLHFLLGGRESWRGLLPAAIATGLLWIGLGVFAAFYFSSTIVSDSHTYGTIGVTFTLVTWFIAIGAVLTLGAVVGAVWHRRRSATANPDQRTGGVRPERT